jgi:hypothetical protein
LSKSDAELWSSSLFNPILIAERLVSFVLDMSLSRTFVLGFVRTCQICPDTMQAVTVQVTCLELWTSS